LHLGIYATFDFSVYFFKEINAKPFLRTVASAINFCTTTSHDIRSAALPATFAFIS